MRKLILILSSIGCVLLLGVLAVKQVRAQAPAKLLGQLGNLDERFAQLDKDSDGKLSSTECPKRLFSMLDTNHDGSVMLLEAKTALQGAASPSVGSNAEAAPVVTGLFTKLDANADDQLTRDELKNHEAFDRLDRDQDGTVSRAEALAVADQIKAYLEKRGGLAAIPSTTPTAPVKAVAQGPLPLKPGDVGVGRQLPDITLTDLQGHSIQLSALAKKGKGLVIALTSTTCPVSQRYFPSLARLEASLKQQDLRLVLLNAMQTEKPEAMLALVQKHGLQSPYVHDAAAAKTLHARSTTEVIFLDTSRTLRYRGALDDQYGVSYNLDAPRQQFLQDAIDDHLAGRLPVRAATEAPGCELDTASVAAAASPHVNYHRDVARILQQNCVSCHHEGGSAPFSLEHADEVMDRAKTIQRVISEGSMPPWFAKPEPDGKPSPWANERSLASKDKADLLAWLSSKDRPMGDATDAPAKLHHSKEGWRNGEPDKVFTFAKPQPVKAEGKMPYQNVVVETGLTEDLWIRGYEVQPGTKAVVHHVLVFLQEPGKKGRGEHDGFFAAFVPGAGAEWFPRGFAKRLPAGSSLRFQMHYTPNGTATQDSTRIGIYLAHDTPTYEVGVGSVTNTRLIIPAFAPHHEVVAHRAAPTDMTLMAFSPHMHVRGKAYRYELVENGQSRVLLDIPNYDFNWQLQYQLKEPLHLPKGTVLKGIAHYDNSSANKANPDPSKEVRWGPQTEDEMMIGYITYYTPVRL